MENIIDFERVHKFFLEQTNQITNRLKDAIEKDRLVRLDECAREVFHELGDLVLQEVFGQIGNFLRFADKSPPVCSCCGQPLEFKQMRKMPFRSSLTGKERQIKSPMMVCRNCRTGNLWMREHLDLDRDGFMQRLRELSVKAGAIETFEGASEEIMADMVGVKVSGSKIHTLCQDGGKTAEELMYEGALGEARPLLRGEKLYVEADGGMLHIDGDWHEAKLAIAFPQSSLADISKERRAITHRQVVSTLCDREDLGKKLLKMVEGYLPQTPDGAPIIAGNVVVLGDGAKWIFNMMEEHLPGATFILDW